MLCSLFCVCSFEIRNPGFPLPTSEFRHVGFRNSPNIDFFKPCIVCFRIRLLLNRVIKISKMRIIQIGRVKNGSREPLFRISPLRRFSSSMGPRISPRINGASGYFIFLSGYPISPNTNITRMSNILPLIAKEPTAHNTKMIGMRIVVGTRRILTTSLTMDSPRITFAIEPKY